MKLSDPLNIVPLPAPPHLIWRVPGSKSITNRALILAALADGESQLEGVLESDDTRHMRLALEALGIAIEANGEEGLSVHGGKARLHAAPEPLFVGNSGTSVRFLTALAALVEGETVLYGDEAMSRRPIDVLVFGLRQLGVQVDCATGSPPLSIRGGRLPGGTVRMQGDFSSQYFSALLMAGALAETEIVIEIEGSLVSRPYVDITRRMIADFGGEAIETPTGFRVRPIAGYRSQRYTIEPDATAASYAFALAAASGGVVEVPGLGGAALQGDYAFVDLLEQAGARVEKNATGTIVRGTGTLRGLDVDMRDISDTVMTLAAIAPLCQGTTRIRNIANIRIKETDRLAATAAELERLGQGVATGEDWITIEPRPLRPATIRTYKDHRMAMSFAVLGAVRPGISIEDPGCVSKTYPCFFDDLGKAYLAAGAPPPW